MYRDAVKNAVPLSVCEGSIELISHHCGKAGGVTLVQRVPPSVVTCTRPSADPVQITCWSSGETASAEMSGKTSALDWSRSIGPPEGSSVLGSLRVRSGLSFCHVCPPSLLRKTYCEAT